MSKTLVRFTIGAIIGLPLNSAAPQNPMIAPIVNLTNVLLMLPPSILLIASLYKLS